MTIPDDLKDDPFLLDLPQVNVTTFFNPYFAPLPQDTADVILLSRCQDGTQDAVSLEEFEVGDTIFTWENENGKIRCYSISTTKKLISDENLRDPVTREPIPRTKLLKKRIIEATSPDHMRF